MKIALASCCKLQSVNPQPVWDDIRAASPDALLLLGDNVYLDCDDHDDPAALAAELARLYAAQLAEPHFAALLADLRARGKPLFATYDDHDFLGNDRCGVEASLALRDAARNALIAAFDPPRTGDELFSSRVLGPVRLIVLDARRHRASAAASRADRDALLGAAQWAWLEAELARRDTPYVMLASSTTFHAWRKEAWEFYPAAFERLRALLSGRAGALLCAGDIHANGLYDDSGVIEVVCSGVARRGLLFGGLRRNFGLLDFGADGLHIRLVSNKPGHRFETFVALADWQLA